MTRRNLEQAKDYLAENLQDRRQEFYREMWARTEHYLKTRK